MSFYGSKIILDHPNHFGRVPIVLDKPNLFWSRPNNFGQVQIIKISPEKSHLNLTKMIWTWLKQFEPVKNGLDGPISIWNCWRTRHWIERYVCTMYIYCTYEFVFVLFPSTKLPALLFISSDFNRHQQTSAFSLQ